MGRLFWKFFFFIWLAQLASIVGLGGVLWLKDVKERDQWAAINRSPPVYARIEIASLALQHAGVSGLKQFLQKPSTFTILAIDAQGRDLLGRDYKPEWVTKARQMLRLPPERATVREVRSPDGQVYLLFSPRNTESLAAQGAEYGNPPPEASPPRPRPNQAGPDASPPPPGMRPPTADQPHPATEMPPPPPSIDRPSLGQARPNTDRFLPLAPLASALFASLVLAFFLAWYFAKPIRNLRAAFTSAAQGDLSVRIAKSMGKRRDELADLGRDFDHMANQLQNLMEGQRRLLHDVSHEMRSPLARLQMAIGLARQQPAKWETSLSRIERESERMDLLVGELLTLSRLEGGVSGAHSECIPMQNLVSDVIEDARFEAEGCGRQIILQQPEAPITLYGQAELLHRALENIVRNAIRHTPAGSSVLVQTLLKSAPERLILQVQDHGPGVAEHELESIFDAFYRGESPSGTGYGLGLAIARRIVETHGGQIRASNRPEGGLCVEISLPLKPAPERKPG